ncbi:hypothetical protein Ancab_021145 [Ancistrocladus abbreviatus]
MKKRKQKKGVLFHASESDCAISHPSVPFSRLSGKMMVHKQRNTIFSCSTTAAVVILSGKDLISSAVSSSIFFSFLFFVPFCYSGPSSFKSTQIPFVILFGVWGVGVAVGWSIHFC